MLSAALQQHFLFSELTPTDLGVCMDVMGSVEAAAGDDIVVQGERGSRFFVVEEGSASVRSRVQLCCVASWCVALRCVRVSGM